eukprot:EC724648.1.p4 GENE.EC724648.1~~EC724648.1.p4  ORF type:complete len:51 (-),score=7.53 EC724648.1:61-213(-)
MTFHCLQTLAALDSKAAGGIFEKMQATTSSGKAAMSVALISKGEAVPAPE